MAVSIRRRIGRKIVRVAIRVVKRGCFAVLTVGPHGHYATPSAAVAASHDGDTISVEHGTYRNDFATVTTNVAIVGEGGMAEFVATVPPPNGKAILVTAGDVTLDHLAFSGAKVPDSNGAGVRYERGHLTIRNSYFHDNQMGLLAAGDRDGTVTVEHSEFSHNLVADGSAHIGHNLYIGGPLKSVVISDSYFHDAIVGHEIKSRALATTIVGNRIFDLAGTASYSIDLPNGGNALIRNNLIQQGPNSENPAIVAYLAEAPAPWPGSRLEISGNTIVNQLPSVLARGLANHSTAVAALVSDNHFYGLEAAQIASGRNTQSGNDMLTVLPALDLSHPWAAGP